MPPLPPPVPTSTYRLQLSRDFTFADAAGLIDQLSDLGVSHLYLSPILQAAPGSSHGYDVVDHARLSEELGGDEGWRTLVAAARGRGLGLVVDIVPNHMAIPSPEHLNPVLWSVLREGLGSPHARWFDIDWESEGYRVLLPILAGPLDESLAELSLEPRGGPNGEAVLRYHDHVLPVAPGTEALPLPVLLTRQHYRLADWRVQATDLNYRRFFTVSSLIGLRVERSEVFDATHRRIAELVDRGEVDGLRVDHPDGLAGPAEYLDRLAEASGGRWTVVEKILVGSETLPAAWRCAGTTGYDALRMVDGLFHDPRGAEPLTSTYVALTGEPADFAEAAEIAKRDVLDEALGAETNRLTQLLQHVGARRGELGLEESTFESLRSALVELLVALPVYRVYVTPGQPPTAEAVTTLTAAAEGAQHRRPEQAAEIALLRDLALGRLGRDPLLDEFVVRFQQTSGPAMAKGVEDTAFYRWNRLISLNEVGGEPGELGIDPAAFHRFCKRLQREWPHTMTTLATHDTKRSADVRARLAVLSELPIEWAEAAREWRAMAATHRSEAWPDANAEYHLWQTLVGAWPISAERIGAYMEKAAREAKRHTSWIDPDPGYEGALRRFVERVLADRALTDRIERFVARVAPHGDSNSLGALLVQLAMPGVPDVYRGAEAEQRSLVDPDNRRPVDHARIRSLMGRLGAGRGALEVEKLRTTGAALRLRRERPERFGARATYRPMRARGRAARHALAFARSGAVVAVVTRLPATLERRGGWRDTALPLPIGSWRNLLDGTAWSDEAGLGALLRDRPIALLVRDGA